MDHDLDDRPGDPVVVQTWLKAPALSYARRPATVVDAQVRRSVFSDAPDLVPISTRHGRFGVCPVTDSAGVGD